MQGLVTDLHAAWRYKWLTTQLGSVAGITVNNLAIMVPFPHYLREAYFAYSSHSGAGATPSVDLDVTDDGEATAVAIGPQLLFPVGEGTDANARITKLDLGEEKGRFVEGSGAIYNAVFGLLNVGDIFEGISLTIGVSPFPSGPPR